MCAIRNAGKLPQAPQCQSLLTLRLCTCFLLDFRTSIPIPLPISKQCQVLIIQVSTKPPFIQLKYYFPRNSLPDLCQKILFPNRISSFLKFIILATTCLLLFFFFSARLQSLQRQRSCQFCSFCFCCCYCCSSNAFNICPIVALKKCSVTISRTQYCH